MCFRRLLKYLIGMLNNKGQKAASKLQIIFLLSVLVIGGHIAYSIGMIFYRYYDLDNELRGLALVLENEPKEKIRAKVLQKIKMSGIRCDTNRLNITSFDNSISIRLPYTERFTLEFGDKKFYSKDFFFEINVNKRY